jgi:ketosteroid isomerase-like protein
MGPVSRENVELVRRVYEAHERGDFATVFAAYDPAIEWDVRRMPAVDAPLEGVHVGHDGVRTFWRGWLAAWETTSFEYEEFIDAGERVIVPQRQRMRGRASGVEVDVRSTQVWTVRRGKLVRMEFFRTRAEALQAVGLRESNSVTRE